MVSQEGKVKASKFLMLFSFLGVMGIPLPMNPAVILANTLVRYLGLSSSISVSVAALFMFVTFLIGVGLYLRNRKHWNDI
ncbi:MAG: hypothetical protein ABEK16_02025 [Candidatus Nanohalobium sp.]